MKGKVHHYLGRPLLIAILLSMSFTSTFSQDRAMGDSEKWEVTLAPYMLFGSLDGTSQIGNVGSIIDADFGDILKKLQFAFMLHGEVQKGEWGLMADFIYLKLGDDLETFTGGIVDASVKESILETMVNYRIKKDWGRIDVYGGIRWWDIRSELELIGIFTGETQRDEGWVDPVIGSRFFHHTEKGIIAGLSFDIGGFGIGSKFSFNIQPSLGYRFTDLFTLMLQFKYLDINFENDETGRDFFAMNAATHGPLLGFVFQF